MDKIKKAKESKAYKKYIDYIRFPKYKNIQPNTKIEFEFPITAFVGKNGSGKSSVLKALYSCVEGNSLGDYWFSTSVDEIKETDSDRNCFIYNYPSLGEDADYEVLFQRASRKDNPDYWETARPIDKYGMKRNPEDKNYRKKKPKMECIYIDFHSLLSAFDVYRYFIKKESIKDTNAYLRKKTISLKKCLDSGEEIRFRGKKHSGKPVNLSDEEVHIISKILGKNYTSGRILNHRFFKSWGYSVIFNNADLSYSEAIAGSGETSIAILINKLYRAQKGSLILLDEPEVCLHPGAQKALLDYLIEICYKKQLQIVISTHSPEFINNLPDCAIKVFQEKNDGYIDVVNECNYLSAFSVIGKDIENKKNIIVEDELAKQMIIEVAKSMEGNIDDQISVKYGPGGVSAIYRMIGISSELKEENKFYILDGDQKKNTKKIFDLTFAEANDKTFLKRYILELTGVEVKTILPKNSNEAENLEIKRYISFCEYFEKYVRYLPLNTPEEIIWDNDYVRTLVNNDQEIIEKIELESVYKDKFSILTETIKGVADSLSILDTQRMFLTRWKKNQGTNIDNVKEIITYIIR